MTEQSAGTGLVNESVLGRIGEDWQAETELTLVTKLLNDLPELRRDPDARVNSYVDGLVKRRAELLQNVGPTFRGLRSGPVQSLVALLGPHFTPWVAVNLPYFAEGIDQRPDTAGTSGSFATTALVPGGVEFEGTPQDAGTVNPSEPKWWVRNWTGSYVFPPAPFDGWLNYRFTTETSFGIFDAPVMLGQVSIFVTIGTTSDVQFHSPFDPGHLATVGWPVLVTLPQSAPMLSFEQLPTPVAGSIQVQAGKVVAIGFVYGIVAGIASGRVVGIAGSMRTRLTLQPGEVGPTTFDTIEYRFEPDWWVRAVSDRLAAATSF